jgi:MFS family permease
LPTRRDVTEARSWRSAALAPALIFIAATSAVVSSLGAPLIPVIARSEHVPLGTAQWLLTAALLAGAVVTPGMGRLADGAKQRTVVLASLSTVLAGCVLAATVNSFPILVVGRALQGVGLGLVPVTMAVVRRHLDFAAAKRAIAALSISSAIGVGLGYPLTGLIAQVFDFHGAYWFGAIVISVGLVLAFTVLPPTSEVPARRFDVVGTVVLSAAVIGISVVLSEGGVWGWTSPGSLGLLIASAVCIGWWSRHELRTADPLINLRQVRNRTVLTADVSGFMICVVMYLFIPVVVEFVQIPRTSGYGFGASISVSGLVLVPLSVGTYVASRFREVYERRFGMRTMIPLGSMVFAVSTVFFALERHALWEAFAAVGFAGLGVGFTFAAMPGLIVRSVPAAETGSAMGFYQVLRSVGLSVGSALSAAVLTIFTHHGDTYPVEEGFRVALLISSGLCLLTALVSFVLPGRTIAESGEITESAEVTGQRPVAVSLDASSVQDAPLSVPDASP